MGLEIVVLFIVTLLTSTLRKHHLQAEYMALFDPLTGVSNRNNFFVLAEQVLHQAKRYGRPFSLAFIDLDNFKLVNDQQGHHEGDAALKAVAEVMNMSLRQADIIVRIGGDEFVVMFPETDYSMALLVLKKLQASLLREMKRMSWPITFIIGAVVCRNYTGSADELLRLADKCLYTVKSGSKNDIYVQEI